MLFHLESIFCCFDLEKEYKEFRATFLSTCDGCPHQTCRHACTLHVIRVRPFFSGRKRLNEPKDSKTGNIYTFN